MERVIVDGLAASSSAIDGDEVFGTSTADGVWRVQREGGRAVPLVPDVFNPSNIVVDDWHIFFSDNSYVNPRSIGVFWANRAGRAAGGGRTPAFITGSTSRAFAVHGAFVYAIAGEDVVEVYMGGGEPTVLASVGDACRPHRMIHCGIAVDADRVYWTQPDADGVLVLKSAPH